MVCRRDFGKPHGVGITDVVLAATADSGNAELKTLNVKHYATFRGLRSAYFDRWTTTGSSRRGVR